MTSRSATYGGPPAYMILPIACRRCGGEGQTDVDRLQPVAPELCHRCDGSSWEPAFFYDPDLYRVEWRRILTRASDRRQG